MRSPKTAYVAVVLALVCIVGCKGAGSGDDPNAPLSGTLRVAEFVVPAGVVRKVVDDLKIFATGKIQIDGELRVVAGASLALVAQGDLIISGRLLGEDGALPDADGGDSRSKPSAKSVTRTVARALESDLPHLFVGGRIKLEKGSVFHRQGGKAGVYFASTTATGTIEIGGEITGMEGDPGRTALEDGRPGASIEIGTERAVDAAAVQVSVAATSPARIVVDGYVNGGTGGWGYSQSLGEEEVVGRAIHWRSSSGGAGGGVNMKASVEIDARLGKIGGGRGGPGGTVGHFANGNAWAAPNGEGEGQPGWGVVAITGNGGAGGSMRFDAPRVDTGPSVLVGAGGRAGATSFGTGNGGPGGNGGDATITLGMPGADGTGGSPRPPDVYDRRSGYIEISGGNGGDAENRSLSGGQGGTLRIAGPEGVVVSLDDSSRIEDFGNGGKGFNGCGTTPTTRGTAGGHGGDLKAAVTPLANLRFARSFNGANGGDGNGPGMGGAAGRNLDTGAPLGIAGANGGPCPVIETASLTLTRVGNGAGTITSQPAGITCGESCTATFVRGTEVTLSATTDGGAAPVIWGGDCASAGSSQTCTLTMDADKAVGATLSDGYVVTVRKAGTGSGSVQGTGGISCGAACSAFAAPGSSVTLTATADLGSTFAGWSGDCSGTGACTRSNILTPQDITATFNLLPADAGLPPDAGLSTTALWAQFRVSETTTLIRNGAGFAPAQAPLPQAELRPPTQATVRHLGPVVISIITPGAPPVPAPATITATTPINSMTATYSGTTGRYTDSFANPSGPFFDGAGVVFWTGTGQPDLTTSAPPAAAGATLGTPAGAGTDVHVPRPVGPSLGGINVGLTFSQGVNVTVRDIEPADLPDGGFGVSAPVNALIDSAVAALAPDGGRDFFLADPKNITLSVDVGNIAQVPWSVFDDPAQLSSTRRTQISGSELGIGCPFGEARCGTTGVCTDLSLSIDHCGRCGNVCLSALRGAPVCEGYRCTLDCETGYGDCDGNLVTGCEQRLNVPEHCGACNRLPTEVCDGLDNTCDNQVDEGCPRRISIPSETIVNSPVWGNTQPPGALSSLQADCGGGPNLNVMIGICGSYTTHVRQLGAYCGTHSLVSQTSTVPYTYAFTRGATGGCNRNGSPTGNPTQFDFVCPANMVVRRIFGEASGDLGKVGVECAELKIVAGTGNTWTLAEGATTTSEAYGSGMGTPFSWPSATTPGGALRALYGTYGIQNPVWVISTIGVTFRLDLYP